MVMEDLEQQPEGDDRQWEFCCSHSSRECVKYISQMVIAGSILVFSFIQLSISDKDRDVYISLVSFIIGLVFPNPSLTKRQ